MSQYQIDESLTEADMAYWKDFPECYVKAGIERADLDERLDDDGEPPLTDLEWAQICTLRNDCGGYIAQSVYDELDAISEHVLEQSRESFR